MIPTLPTLERICRVYGIGLGHFFCEPQLHSLAITRKAEVEDGRRSAIARPTPLHVPTAEGKLVSKIVDLPAGVASTVGECGSASEVTAYVLEGTLHVSLAGSHGILEQGDCMVAHTDQALIWSADAEAPCRILSVSAK